MRTTIENVPTPSVRKTTPYRAIRLAMRRAVCLTLCLLPATLTAEDLQLTETDSEIQVTLRDKPVLRYRKTPAPLPEGVAPHFLRTGYIHPVYAPTGQAVTGDYPEDHPHQHALFFAWTKTKFAGQPLDFWNQAKRQAGVEFRRVVAVTRDADHVSFTVEHAFTSREPATDVLRELWTVTVYHTPDDHFVFDIESVQECVQDKPLTLPQYRYGGMALRGPAHWLLPESPDSPASKDRLFLTSEGHGRIDGNHTAARWVAMSGDVDAQQVSITVLSSPRNFRAPQPVRLHPTKPYFCFSPMVTGKFSIEPGQPYVSRYRYLVTSATADASWIERQWQQYVAAEQQASTSDSRQP